ncbi:hypothetical protein NMG60_11017921 [Bertholletia excelsa]
MAMAAFRVTALAAASLIFSFSRINSNSKFQELGRGFRAWVGLVATTREEDEKSSKMPKLAPQFDGLHCFETFVG